MAAIERLVNRVGRARLPTPSARAVELHAESTVVDLHADSLLWGRDLERRSFVGHVDLPRLRAGNVALQVFTVVSRVPMSVNIHRTDERWPDLVSLLGRAHGWPASTRRALLPRVLHQTARLDDLAERDRHVVLVRRSGDLDELLRRRRDDRSFVGALLGIEGAHALDGDPGNLEVLHERGVRLVGLAHFFDNEFAGSAHGRRRTGLTPEGRDLLRRMERLGVIVDLAHASERTIADVLTTTARPPVVSHTGVRGTCDNPRNLSDEQLRAIAAAGGVVGVGFWKTAVGGAAPADVARAVRHAVDVVGADDHVALGSDFDGAVKTPFDASGLVQVTNALLEAGFVEPTIRKILGENALRLVRAVLPG